MPQIPEFRDQDETPNRKDDISIPVPWASRPVTINGANIYLMMLIAILGVIIWHHTEAGKQSAREFEINKEIALLTAAYNQQNVCVIRLNEQQRQEDRQTGKYCADPVEEIRRYIKFKEKALRDP